MFDRGPFEISPSGSVRSVAISEAGDAFARVCTAANIASIITDVHRDWSDSRVSSLFPPFRSTNK